MRTFRHVSSRRAFSTTTRTPTVLAETLGDTLGVRVVVEKARRLLTWRNVRIHVDRVAGLGDFVELEAVASTADGLDAERPRIDRLTDALGIDDSLLVSEGYAEMLEARRPALGVRGRYGTQGATGR